MSVRTLPSPLALDDFELGVTLGTGSFGRVRFCTHKVRSPSSALLVSFNSLFLHVYPYCSEHWVILGHENAKEV